MERGTRQALLHRKEIMAGILLPQVLMQVMGLVATVVVVEQVLLVAMGLILFLVMAVLVQHQALAAAA